MQITGVFGPLVTTFDKSGELDLAAFAGNIRAHLTAGLDGVVVTGSTGEAALLDRAERQQLVEAARRAKPSEKRVIVGVGAESTRTTIQFAKDAAERGANLVLVVAPHYYGTNMTEAALRAHYSRVADASPVPVLLYNIPKYMHLSISPALLAELASHGNIVGVKDSSGNRDLLTGYLQAQSNSFSVLTGSGQLWEHALQSGVRGGILAVALFATGLSLDVYNAIRAKDQATADAAQALLTPLAAKIVGELGVAGVKAALDHAAAGLMGGPVRSPLLPLGASDLAVVHQMMDDAMARAAA